MPADQFRQMRAQHADRIDHRVVRPARALRLVRRNPPCRHAEGRLARGLPAQRRRGLAHRNGQFATLRQFVARDFDALERNHVFARLQRQIVGHAHRREQIAEIARQLPPDAGDSAQQRRVLPPSTSRTRPSPTSTASGSTRSTASRFSRAGAALVSVTFLASMPALAHPPGRRAHARAQQQERNRRQARKQRQRHQHAAGQQQRLRIAEHLLAKIRAQPRVGAGAGHDQAARDRDHQRRDHRDQAVADGQHGVGFDGAAQIHAVLQDADQEIRR